MHVEVHRQGFGPVEWSVESDLTHRKQRGIFFTPWPIANHLAERLIREIDDDAIGQAPTLCDPFIGAGVLPAAVVEALAPRAGALWGDSVSGARAKLLQGVFGVDLDANHLSLARRILSGCGALDAPHAEHFGAFDALTTPVGRVLGEHLWNNWSEVFARGGFDIVVANPPWEKVRVNDREFFSGVEPGFSRLPRAERDVLRASLLQGDTVRAAYEQYAERIDTLKRAAKSDYDATGAGGDLDMYKLAIERVVQLLRPGGYGAVIVPHGLLGDWGARHLRSLLFSRCRILSITRIETGRELFPEIHANLGVVVVVFRKTKATADAGIGISTAIRTAAGLKQPDDTAISHAIVARATPHNMIPLVDNETDVALLKRCLSFPRLGEWPETDFRPRREIDMTNDRQHFLPRGQGLPLLEGKHISPFAAAIEDRRWDVTPSAARSSQWRRIAWRAVADRAMHRRLFAAWVPQNVGLGNSLIYTGQTDASPEGLLWLLAWMNSRVAEAQLRLWCANNNINIFHVKVCRVPRFDQGHPDHRRLVELANELVLWGTQGTIDPLGTNNGEPISSQQADAYTDELDRLWQSVYDIDDTVWKQAVLRRTRPVSDWPRPVP